MVRETDGSGSARQRSFPQFLSYRIFRLHLALNAQAIDVLGNVSGLGLGQWRLLSVLGLGLAATARDLASLTDLDPAFVSRTLRSLEEKGLIRTKRPDSDRRLLEVELTNRGRSVYEATLPHMEARHDALIGALDAEEQEVIFAILDKLERAAQKRGF